MATLFRTNRLGLEKDWSADGRLWSASETGRPLSATVTGTAGDDDLTGTEEDDTIDGLGGFDLIRGLGGNDVINGGDEATPFGDGIDGGAGDDTINGGGGNDVLGGGAGSDVVNGGDGNDIISGDGGGVAVAFSGFTVINGVSVPVRSFNLLDLARDDGAVDTLNGGAGNDIIYAGAGDIADGGEGMDTLAVTFAGRASGLSLDMSGDAQAALAGLTGGRFAGFENFRVDGTSQNDRMIGSQGSDTFNGGNGDDELSGGAGNDSLFGGNGSDTLDGGEGNDFLSGSTMSFGLLTADGRTGREFDDGVMDILNGGASNDSFEAGARDRVDGGEGTDTVNVSLAGRSSGVTLDLRTGDVIAQVAAAMEGTLTNVEGVLVSGLTNFDDVFFRGATSGGNIYGLGGNDRITGSDLAEFMGGNEGDDTLDSGGGNDRLWGGAGDDHLIGGAGIDILYGDENNNNGLAGPFVGNDRLEGGDGNDQLFAGAGNDLLTGGSGNDLVNGGAGFDLAIYTGTARQYVANAGSVSGNGEGTDTLVSIEGARFTDGTLSFDVDGQAAQVMRLYDAALDRQPDQAGFEGLLDQLESGRATTLTLAQAFIASPEFQARYGNLDNQQFVEQLYRFSLDREGDAAGIAGWVNNLNNGTTRAEALVFFSESAEHRTLTQGTLNAGLWVADDQATIIARLYDATFDRLPDAAGLAVWTNNLKAGMPLVEIAAAFASAQEFQDRYGALSNQQFVEQLYRFCLDREGDAAGVAGWVANMEDGLSRAEVLRFFSESAEHVALTQPLWLGGIRTLESIRGPVLDDLAKTAEQAQVLIGLDEADTVMDGKSAFDPAADQPQVNPGPDLASDPIRVDGGLFDAKWAEDAFVLPLVDDDTFNGFGFDDLGPQVLPGLEADVPVRVEFTLNPMDHIVTGGPAWLRPDHGDDLLN